MKVGRWLAWVGALVSLSGIAEAQPAPAEAAPSCFPSCREGYVCSAAGSCVSRCNPPCAASETCLASGECQRPEPAAPPPPAAAVAPAYVPPPPPVSAPAPADESAAPDRRGRFVLGLRVGVKPSGGGDRALTCAASDGQACAGASASVSVDDTTPVNIAAEGLVHVTQALRLGGGYSLVPYASIKSSVDTESFHLGSEHRLVAIVEGVIPLSQLVGLALRFQGGATMFLPGGDLSDQHQALVDTCPASLCQSDKGPFFGANYALMVGILAGQEQIRFRGDVAFERFSHQLGSIDLTLASGGTVHLEEKLYGTRFWISAGLELF